MVKKFLKKSSKRQSLHHKYKVEKKVREHHRKVRKEAKKKALSGGSKLKKDPGIPNLWPLKEEFLKKIQDKKEKLEQEKQRQKQDRQRELARRRADALKQAQGGDNDIAAIAAEANMKSSDFEKKQKQKEQEDGWEKSALNLRDGSLKAYYREFKKIVENADVILEVLDARDPLGCRTPDIERKILAKHPNKKIILILNKIDLIPKPNVEAWLKYLRNDLPTVAFKCSTQVQRKNLGHSNTNVKDSSHHALETSECIGADTLVQLLKNYTRNLNLKTSIAVGIIGYPNVGKSSLINSLKRSKAVGVGATPGFTKTAQEIHLDKNIKLLDSPGIVFSANKNSDNDIILRNCVKVEQIPDPIEPVEAILKRCKAEQILQIYKIPTYKTVTEFLVSIAQKKGKLGKGGKADLKAAARSVLQDWNGGKIPFFTEPPQLKNVHLSASIVNQWGKEFDIESILKQEQQNLASMPNMDTSELLPLAPGSMDESQMMEEEVMEDDEDEDEDEDEEGEEMDDDEMEGEEGESMQDVDEDEEEEEEVQAPKKQVKKQKWMTEAEEINNPQRNKNLKQQLKKQKKMQKKMTPDEKAFAEMKKQQPSGPKKGSNEAYDFNEFFEDMESDGDIGVSD